VGCGEQRSGGAEGQRERGAEGQRERGAEGQREERRGAETGFLNKDFDSNAKIFAETRFLFLGIASIKYLNESK